MLRIIKVLNVNNIYSNFDLIINFYYGKIYVAVFTTPLERNNSDFSSLFLQYSILAPCSYHAND